MLVVNSNDQQTNTVVVSNNVLRSTPNFDNLLLMPRTNLGTGQAVDLSNIPTSMTIGGTPINFLCMDIFQGFSNMPIGGLKDRGKSSWFGSSTATTAGTSYSFNFALNTPLEGGEIIGKQIIYSAYIMGNLSAYNSSAKLRAFLIHQDGTKTYLSDLVSLDPIAGAGNFQAKQQVVFTNGTIAQAGDFVGCDATLYVNIAASGRSIKIGRGNQGSINQLSMVGGSSTPFIGCEGIPFPIEISID